MFSSTLWVLILLYFIIE